MFLYLPEKSHRNSAAEFGYRLWRFDRPGIGDNVPHPFGADAGGQCDVACRAPGPVQLEYRFVGAVFDLARGDVDKARAASLQLDKQSLWQDISGVVKSSVRHVLLSAGQETKSIISRPVAIDVCSEVC